MLLLKRLKQMSMSLNPSLGGTYSLMWFSGISKGRYKHTVLILLLVEHTLWYLIPAMIRLKKCLNPSLGGTYSLIAIFLFFCISTSKEAISACSAAWNIKNFVIFWGCKVTLIFFQYKHFSLSKKTIRQRTYFKRCLSPPIIQKNNVFRFFRAKSKSTFCPINFIARISSVDTGISKMLSLFS